MRYAWLCLLFALAACGNELPEESPGNRIRGGLRLSPTAAVPRSIEQPGVRVIAFYNFPPGSAFSYTTLIEPDFSRGLVPFEIERVVAAPGYTIAATFVDLASTDFFPTAEEVQGYPAGAYPNVCDAVNRRPPSLIEVTDNGPVEDVNFTLYSVFSVQNDVPIPEDPCIFQGGL